MERKVTYFEEIRPENTDLTFRLVQECLKSSDIKKIVLASTTGATALKAMEFFKGEKIQLIVVPHQYDFYRAVNRFTPELVKTLQEAGHMVHFGTMLFHTGNLYESTAPTLMANLLRCFSQGVKVCFEIVLMATDAGLLTPGEKVIAVAGTAKGSDTALVMQAASSQHLKNLRVLEMLCKPLHPLNIDELHERMAQEKPQDYSEKRK
jgi:hypothetical protein